MSDISLIAINASSQASQARIQSVTTVAAGLSGRSSADKIERSAREFESILLSKWLESAESSFAMVPGEDDQEDKTPGKDQFQSLAMQAVAGSMARHGGIGIASMIISRLSQRGQSVEPEVGHLEAGARQPGTTPLPREK